MGERTPLACSVRRRAERFCVGTNPARRRISPPAALGSASEQLVLLLVGDLPAQSAPTLRCVCWIGRIDVDGWVSTPRRLALLDVLGVARGKRRPAREEPLEQLAVPPGEGLAIWLLPVLDSGR